MPHPTRVPSLVAAVLILLLTSAGWTAWRGRRQAVTCPVPSDGPAEVIVGESPEEAVGSIRQVLDEQAAAWNRGDLEGFMRGYWPSPQLSFFSGSNATRGWQATLERYRRRYQSEGQEMGRLSFRDIEIEPLGPDSALVRGRWQLVRSKDRPGGLFTLIFHCFPEGWRIVHDHTSS